MKRKDQAIDRRLVIGTKQGARLLDRQKMEWNHPTSLVCSSVLRLDDSATEARMLTMDDWGEIRTVFACPWEIGDQHGQSPRRIMVAKTISINRAPVLTPRTTAVGQRVGFTQDKVNTDD